MGSPLSIFLYRKPELCYGELSLDEKRLTRARRKAAASASHGRTKGIMLDVGLFGLSLSLAPWGFGSGNAGSPFSRPPS
jgi:hypothetical protein